ncbi:MAG TPA: hypothetical protein VHQ47_11980 [Phycisphaerae bacterium]|nr:hypothetical protein [Phycisphaerae bacterium]
MKRILLLIPLLAVISLGQAAQNPPPRIIDTVILVPNGFTGPIFVNQRLVLPEIDARQKNTYRTTVVDRDGEAVQIGAYDKIPGCSYPITVVQRNGLPVKGSSSDPAIADDDIAFRQIGGYGPGNRSYRPGGFAAYFIGTKSQADAFHAQLDQLVDRSLRQH